MIDGIHWIDWGSVWLGSTVVDIKLVGTGESRLTEIRMERESKQPALIKPHTFRYEARFDVQKRSGQQTAVLDYVNGAALIGYKDAIRIVASVGDTNGCYDLIDTDRLQLNRRKRCLTNGRETQ